MLNVLTIAGGVALILFGIRFLRKGLDRLLGDRLGQWVQRLSHGRMRAFFSGIGLAVVAPSSTTVSLLAVQTIHAGHADARRMLALVFGADVGLTAMVLLIALRAERFAPLLVLAGVGLFQFTRMPRPRGIGQVILALGFILMGIGIIKTTAADFSDAPDLQTLLELAQRHAYLIAAIAAVVAVVLQSSTATIGLAIGLAAAGTVNLKVAIAAVAGANVGIGITALLLGWRNRESRRLTLANLLAKITIAAGAVALLDLFAPALGRLPGGIDRQVAVAHLLFNVTLAIVFLPLVHPLTNLVQRLVPVIEAPRPRPFGPRHINSRPGDNLAVALGQSRAEILRVAGIVREMFDDLWRALENNNPRLAQQVRERDDQVDLLEAAVKRYLAALGESGFDGQAAREQLLQLRYVSELESVGDIIDKNLVELVLKRHRLDVRFSPEGWADLEDFHGKVIENMAIAETAFTTRDPMLAQQLLRHKQRISELDVELRDRHFARLRAGTQQSHETSAIHLDLLTHLHRINSCISHVGQAILQQQPPNHHREG